ncbi:hypothetical protein BDW59DRAFT_143330 [Aspergillus cavernicola]|uniref:Uncharacterized protein n=1 Tax=Aspergillus cavernicola TaxID=176166 RepID=A0ABR4IKE0_9EURO
MINTARRQHRCPSCIWPRISVSLHGPKCCSRHILEVPCPFDIQLKGRIAMAGQHCSG